MCYLYLTIRGACSKFVDTWDFIQVANYTLNRLGLTWLVNIDVSTLNDIWKSFQKHWSIFPLALYYIKTWVYKTNLIKMSILINIKGLYSYMMQVETIIWKEKFEPSTKQEVYLPRMYNTYVNFNSQADGAQTHDLTILTMFLKPKLQN